MANLGALADRGRILEFDLDTLPVDAAERILGCSPRIVGVGVHIWNVSRATELVLLLKRLRPDVAVVVGGPEVGHQGDEPEICDLADHVVRGEGEEAFRSLCMALLEGRDAGPRRIEAPPPALETLELPYDLYDQDDLAHRTVYVEASRGCPFGCEFCLSSLDRRVRQVPLPRLLPALDRLLDRGALRFKFVDRSFNVDAEAATGLLQFFLDRSRQGLFLHFEVVPDRLPGPVGRLIQRFPPGSIQVEVGVQTFDPEVARRIGRNQDPAAVERTLRFLLQETGAHVHADLLIGLPGEDLESFATGFDRLVALTPHEIQLGLLKRLRGTTIRRHEGEWGLVFNDRPPYEIVRTGQIGFPTMQRLRRMSRFFDLLFNSGRFVETVRLLWRQGSPFARFLALSDWLHGTTGRTSGFSPRSLAELLLRYGTAEAGLDREAIEEVMARDFARTCGDPPPFLSERLPPRPSVARAGVGSAPLRQGRHRGVAGRPGVPGAATGHGVGGPGRSGGAPGV
ncbi:MAG: DUF4080 domain-containing protein [Candidatus Riflebacteria bacterium]|nr:DUF4080 domain-containing protein [Candidatus Riflebacteria bacterium]